MRFAVLAALLILPAAGAEWTVSYFFDDPREILEFRDLAFPSVNRGIGVGIVHDQRGERRDRHVAVVTADGGVTWSQVKLDDVPYSLYFLDDSTGWMVGERGIWKTDESGRTWKRVSKHSAGSLLRVWFLDANHGFAVGRQKTVLETKNGGKDWDKVKAAELPTGNRDFAVYTNIAFLNKSIGIIAGSAVPPQRRGFNDKGRQVPTMTMQLETNDGGVTWKPSAAPLFGQVADIELNGNRGLILYSFSGQFEVPSEVYSLNTRGGDTASSFRAPNRRVTDTLLFPSKAFLAAVEPPRMAKEAAFLPGKIRVLEGTDLKEWTEMPVDYRATGAQAILAGADAQHVFLATDNGMILQLQQ